MMEVQVEDKREGFMNNLNTEFIVASAGGQ